MTTKEALICNKYIPDSKGNPCVVLQDGVYRPVDVDDGKLILETLESINRRGLFRGNKESSGWKELQERWQNTRLSILPKRSNE